MMYDLANVLRNAGLIVEEVAGWQNAGHGDVDPQVVVNHHTAGGPNGRAPSLATCIYGVPGVPGPLCNVMQTREETGPDHFIVIAAGNSYNAGTGGWAGFTGNMHTIGLEVEHTGVEWFPDDRREYTWRFNAAVLNWLGIDSSRSCQHFEWSDTGKIDIAQGVDPNYWRHMIGEYQKSPGGGFLNMLSDQQQQELYDGVMALTKGVPLYGVRGVLENVNNMASAGVKDYGLPNLFAGQHQLSERLKKIEEKLGITTP